MQITKEFLQCEIEDLEHEMQKAQAFIIKAQGTIEAYRMLINRINSPEIESAGDIGKEAG